MNGRFGPIAFSSRAVFDSDTNPVPWSPDRPPGGGIDFATWLARVLGWDALLPVLVSCGAVLIARWLHFQPPADVLALVGLPVLAFTVRLLIGYRQIRTNGCGPGFRLLQLGALLLALFILAFVDFFIALAAIAGQGNAPAGVDLLPITILSLLTYLTLVALAMYPGRT